jgi:hypothetical protein
MSTCPNALDPLSDLPAVPLLVSQSRTVVGRSSHSLHRIHSIRSATDGCHGIVNSRFKNIDLSTYKVVTEVMLHYHDFSMPVFNILFSWQLRDPRKVERLFSVADYLNSRRHRA